MKAIVFVVGFFFAASVFTGDVFAIPSFARKYNMTCQTCHSPAPSLKAYGDEFAGNGFTLADKEAPRYFIETGDDELSLIRDLPLAVRLDAFLTYNNSKRKAYDFQTPYNVKILSGGALAKDVAYYFYFFFSERGEVSGVEDAYIMFNDLLGVDLDLYVGQFQVSDPLFKRELRLTLEDYDIYKYKPGRSNISLAYDRGIMLTLGLETGTDIILEMVNGNGIPSANAFRQFDVDKYKSIMGRISQETGEYFRAGGFAYYGKETIYEGTDNEVWIAGPDATVSFNMFELNLQYIFRKDSNPDFTIEKLRTKGAFGELIVRPNGDDSKYYGALIGNWIESVEHKQRTGAAHIGYLLKRNTRLTGEYSYDFEEKYGKFAVGIFAAF